jgi:hypothetical protein
VRRGKPGGDGGDDGHMREDDGESDGQLAEAAPSVASMDSDSSSPAAG